MQETDTEMKSDELITVGETKISENRVVNQHLEFGIVVNEHDSGDVTYTVPRSIQSLVCGVAGVVSPRVETFVREKLGFGMETDVQQTFESSVPNDVLENQTSDDDTSDDSVGETTIDDYKSMSTSEIEREFGGEQQLDDESDDDQKFDLSGVVDGGEWERGENMMSEIKNNGRIDPITDIKKYSSGGTTIRIGKLIKEASGFGGQVMFRVVKDGNTVLYMHPSETVQGDSWCERRVPNDGRTSIPWVFEEGDVVKRTPYENCIEVSLADNGDDDGSSFANVGETREYLQRQ